MSPRLKLLKHYIASCIYEDGTEFCLTNISELCFLSASCRLPVSEIISWMSELSLAIPASAASSLDDTFNEVHMSVIAFKFVWDLRNYYTKEDAIYKCVNDIKFSGLRRTHSFMKIKDYICLLIDWLTAFLFGYVVCHRFYSSKLSPHMFK